MTQKLTNLFEYIQKNSFAKLEYWKYLKIYPKFLDYLKQNVPILINEHIIWYEKSFEFSSKIIEEDDIMKYIYTLRLSALQFENKMISFLIENLHFDTDFVLKNLHGVYYYEK